MSAFRCRAGMAFAGRHVGFDAQLTLSPAWIDNTLPVVQSGSDVMASFVQFLQHSGVYATQSFMIVPQGGFNLVCLRDSKNVGLSYDRDRLQVEDVRLHQVE